VVVNCNRILILLAVDLNTTFDNIFNQKLYAGGCRLLTIQFSCETEEDIDYDYVTKIYTIKNIILV
jgi:hypothetical protein